MRPVPLHSTMKWYRGTMVQHAANQTGNMGRDQSLYNKCNGFCLRALHNRRNQRLYDPSEGRSYNTCIAVEHNCHDRDSNPHSADQKHQSLSPMLLSTATTHLNLQHTPAKTKLILLINLKIKQKFMRH